MADIIVGSAAVEIVPSTRTFASRLRAEIDPLAEKIGNEIGDAIERRISTSIKKGLAEGFAGAGPLASEEGRKSGANFGGAFARTAKARIEAALKALPKADIKIDATQADRQLAELRAELETLLSKNIGIDISDQEAFAKIDEIQVRLAQLATESPNVQIKVDTLAASAELLAFRGELAALGGGKVGGGVSGLGTGIAGNFAKATSATGPLIAAIAAIGAAMVPVVATAAGLVAALVLPVAAAGAGIGIGFILAGFAVKNLEKTSKKIDQLKAKADTLKDPKARAEALAEARDLEKSLTGPQKAFLTAQGHLSAAFAKLQTGKVGNALFAPLVAGMNLLAKIMPALAPVIESVSAAITGLLNNLSKSASGKGFSNFIDGFAKLAGSTITTAATVIGNFAVGLFNIFKDFLPLSKSVGSGLTGLSQSFVNFSKSASTKQGIQSFIDYVKKEGPQVLSFFGNTIKALVRLGAAVAPIGGFFLKVGTLIAKAFNVIPINLLSTVLRRGLLGPLNLIVDVLGFFGVSLGDIGTIASKVGRVVAVAFSYILTAIGYALQGIGGFVGALSKVPVVGGKFKGLSKDLKDAGNDAKNLGQKIRDVGKDPVKVKVDNKDLKDTAKFADTTDASLRKLLGLPPIKPKVDKKPVLDALTGTDLLLNHAKQFGNLPPLALKVNKAQVDSASLSTLILQRNVLSVAGLSTKAIDIKIKAQQAKVAADLIAAAQQGLRALNNTTAKPKIIPPSVAAFNKALGGLVKGFGSIFGSAKATTPKVNPSQITAANGIAAKLIANLKKTNTSNTVKVNKKQADAAATSTGKIVSNLGAIKSKTVTVTVKYVAGPKPAGLAKGTDFWRGGLTWVGEEGPELLNLPIGAKVIANNKTSDYLDKAGKDPSLSWLTNIAKGLATTSSTSGSIPSAAIAAPSSAPSLRLVNGSLSIDQSGRAWISGVAEEVYDSNRGYAQTIGGMTR